MISSCEDERLASPGPCPREDYPFYILRVYTVPYTLTSTHTKMPDILYRRERKRMVCMLGARSQQLMGLGHVGDTTEVESCVTYTHLL